MAGLTVVLALAVLFAALVSVSRAVTLARLVMGPATKGMTAMVILAVALLLIVPSAQVTRLPLVAQTPCDGKAETKLTRVGRLSFTVPLVAGEGPKLVMLIV